MPHVAPHVPVQSGSGPTSPLTSHQPRLPCSHSPRPWSQGDQVTLEAPYPPLLTALWDSDAIFNSTGISSEYRKYINHSWGTNSRSIPQEELNKHTRKRPTDNNNLTNMLSKFIMTFNLWDKINILNLTRIFLSHNTLTILQRTNFRSKLTLEWRGAHN